MTTNRGRLLHLIRTRAYRAGEVTLASGRTSDFYIDGKMIEISPEGAYLIGEVLHEQIRGMNAVAVGGLAVGAVPLVASIVISAYHHGSGIEGFFVRDEAKSHGTMKVIEGYLPNPGDRIVVIDDVITSGKSVMKAIEAVKARGAEIAGVLAIVDRDAGARQFFESQGYRYESVFTKQDVLEGMPGK
ncbi:MAG: orotate phosphoribosyltransferase [Planctomycetes bacterium]|nr:orotate phosphoribosyltransferase [Planctomycetota bacterium]